LVEPHIRPAKRVDLQPTGLPCGSRPRTTNLREVVNAILYLLGTGCQWCALPQDFSLRSTVFDYLDLWEWDGTLARFHHALFVAVREQAGKEASPSVAILDSQGVKSAEKGERGLTPRAMTRASNVKGKKLHVVVYTLGLLVSAVVDPASLQDRDGARPVLARVRQLFPFIERLFADVAYQGEAMAALVRATGR
jgi:transposase